MRVPIADQVQEANQADLHRVHMAEMEDESLEEKAVIHHQTALPIARCWDREPAHASGAPWPPLALCESRSRPKSDWL